MALKFADLTNEISGSYNIDFSRESKRPYLMFFEPGDDDSFVRLNCGFTIGTRHPTDRQQVLLKIEYECLGLVTWEGDNSLCRLWKVTPNYGPWNPAEKGPPEAAGNPLLMPPRYRLEWEKVPEPVWEDAIDGTPILNTAGDPFDPPVERDNLIGILTVRRNEVKPDFPTIMALAGSVNLNPWLGWASKFVRFAPPALPEVEYSQEAQLYYYPMVYVFEINLKDWRKKPLNSGYRQRSPTQINQSRVVTILDDSGQPLQNPGMLDLNGAYLKPPVSKDNLVIGVFDVHPTADFSTFDLDNLFTPPEVLS